MFLSLGNITFEGIKLPQTWEGSYETNYGDNAIIGEKPVIQNTGEKLDEYDIDIFFHSDFCDPRAEFDALQDIRKRGVVNELIDGTGRNFGKFVITTLSLTNIVNSDDGYPIAISAAVHLMEYNGEVVITPVGEALTEDDIKYDIGGAEPNMLSEHVIEAQAPAKQIYATVTSATQKANSIRDKINNAVSFTQGMYNKVSKVADEAKAEFDKVNEQVEKTKKIIYRAKDLKNTITMVNSALQDIKAAADIRNFNDLLIANNKLSQSMYYLDQAKAPIAAFLASRESGD